MAPQTSGGRIGRRHLPRGREAKRLELLNCICSVHHRPISSPATKSKIVVQHRGHFNPGSSTVLQAIAFLLTHLSLGRFASEKQS